MPHEPSPSGDVTAQPASLPATPPQPPPADGTPPPAPHVPSFLERNLGTLLTFVGALATAYVTLTGGLFKPSQPPVARIAVMLGDHKVVLAEDKSPSSAVPVLPLGGTVVLSGASSTDPDGDLAKMRFKWSIARVYPEAGDPVSFGSDTVARIGDRVIHWTPSEEGAYEAVLDVTNDRECNVIVELVASGGCHKTASAILHFAVRRSWPPELRVKDVPAGGAFPFNASIDAQATRTFDDEDIKSLRFSWTLDGAPVSTEAQFSLTINLPHDPDVTEETRQLAGTVTDQWGRTSAYSHAIKLRLPSPSVTTAGLASKPGSDAGAPVVPVQPVTTVVVPGRLDADLDVGVDKDIAAVELPAAILTNGHSLRIHAHSVVARSTVIRAFANPAPSGHPGAPGQSGPDGGGDGGPGGQGGSGEPGTNGGAGSDAGPIEIHADAFSGDLSIDASGMGGGAGGNGGRGGAGGPGGNGAPSSSGAFDCRSGPGRGGVGGTGGAGGRGGDGGVGGAGGRVELAFASLQPVTRLTIVAVGGPSGGSGSPGPGGPGGSGGSEGSTGGWCSSAGRGGPSGPPGAPGSEGALGQPGAAATGALVIGDRRFSATSGVLRYPVPPP